MKSNTTEQANPLTYAAFCAIVARAESRNRIADFCTAIAIDSGSLSIDELKRMMHNVGYTPQYIGRTVKKIEANIKCMKSIQDDIIRL